VKLAALLVLALFTLGNGPDAESMRDADDGGASVPVGQVEPYYSYFGDSSCRLCVAKDVAFPEGRFEIFKPVARRYYEPTVGHAYLRPRSIVSSEYPLGKVVAEIGSTDLSPLEQQTTFFKKDGGKTRLTLDEATRLWGTPRRHSNYYTFDARNFHHGEENIFHLDFLFDKEGYVESYRLRGIELGYPTWLRPKYDFSHGWNFHRFADPQPGTPELTGYDKDQRGQSRIAIKCGDNKAVLDLCIRNARGWIEVNADAYGGSDNVRPNWFETECVRVEQPSVMRQYSRPTLQDLSAWWGTPRNSSKGFYTFDVPCQKDGEADIFHVDVMCDKSFNISDSRLRGPSIMGPDWQINTTPKPNYGPIR
jgi:hypothetical protein